MKQSWRHQGNPSVLPGIQPEPQTSQSHPHFWRTKTLPRSFTPHQRGQKAQGSSLCSPQCRPCRLQKQSLKRWCILCPPHPATVTIAPIKSPLGSWPSECQIHHPRHRKSTVSWPLAQVPLDYEALNECCVQKPSAIFKGVSFQGLCWFDVVVIPSSSFVHHYHQRHHHFQGHCVCCYHRHQAFFFTIIPLKSTWNCIHIPFYLVNMTFLSKTVVQSKKCRTLSEIDWIVKY